MLVYENSLHKNSFKNIFSWLIRFVLTLLLTSFLATPVLAQDTHPKVAEIVAANIAPEGVVFDIETLEQGALAELSDYIKWQIKTLKQAYPNVDIAVVSHGIEEYALQTSNQSKHEKLHSLFANLVEKDEVSVHVCGAVAGLKNLTQEDFPEFVSYSDSGMAQINDYKALGYQVIVIKQLTDVERKKMFAEPKTFLKQ